MHHGSNLPWAVMRDVPDSMNFCQLEFRSPNLIDLELAKRQHAAYKRVLESLGLIVDLLPTDHAFPDCPFVEDTAVVIGDTVILTRPGAASRRGEVDAIRAYLTTCGYRQAEMAAPAQLDGGDVLQIGTDVFVGISRRTNREGFELVAEISRQLGRQAFAIEVTGALHLKSVCTYAGDGTILCLKEALGEGRSQLDRYRCLTPASGEHEAANVCLIHDQVLIPAHCHQTASLLEQAGRKVIPVDISEFHKAEAGLTCLTLLEGC